MKNLAAYARKRDFKATSEPRARVAAAEGRAFVIQKHAARRLHYDLRLDLDGVLKSWAVPKGPSLSPDDKRLAVEVEDHPVDYRDFEGTIPHGQYGGGEVIVWDRGSWTPIGDPHEGLRKGHLRFTLTGEKLAGAWSLVRLKGRDRETRTSWLLLKSRDEHVREGDEADITARAPESVVTGRTVEEIAASTPPPPPSRVRAKSASVTIPAFEPQLATLVDEAPKGPGWLFEMKLDGYRALGVIDGGAARLLSRNGLDWTKRFAPIAERLGHLRVKNAVLDGEVCVFDDQGRTSFQALQNALSAGEKGHLTYVVFDLLYRDGEDLRERPLLDRKSLLATILAGERLPLKRSEHLKGDGEAILKEARRLDLEGILAKRADAPYVSGRTRSWLKIKCKKRQELIIVGYTHNAGKRTGLGALVLGVRDPKKNGALRFVGKVGTGFNAASRAELVRKLAPLARSTPQVKGAPRVGGVIWVEPALVCEVGFTEWTHDGALRHPTFLGLREDKPAEEVVRERPQPVAPRRAAGPLALRGVAITHAERVLDEGSGTTKGDLARYYDAVAELMMPYARRRPLSIVRCPSGRGGPCFFQKHMTPGMGDAVSSAKVGAHEVLVVTKLAGILELSQFGVIEIHGGGARLPRADTPDWMVIDLDPDEGLPYGRVVEAALEVREALLSIGLESWVKTTGGKGLHVTSPFRPRHRWDAVKSLARALAEDLARRSPSAYTSTPSKASRKGKIFVDHLRNGDGATAVLPYSARNRASLTVAMPIAWEDVRRVHPGEITVLTATALLARRRADRWAGFWTAKQSLPAKLAELLAKVREG